MKTVPVNLGSRSYDIHVGHGILDRIGTTYVDLGLGAKAAIVTNPTVAALYLNPVQRSLEAAGIDTSVVTVPDGEEYKTLETVATIQGELIQAGLDRTSCVVTLGGGVIGDMAGFCAATYMRGIDFVQIPTTLEAQVDASVGGKTAVDHAQGKNMVGAFHQPKLVLIDTGTLMSLPKRDVRSGLAEVIKHGLIRDQELTDFLCDRMEQVAELEIEAEDLDWLIAKNCAIKAGVVEADETEKGLREILNYGHTIGHAIESASGFRLRHGEAIALGMMAEAKIAVDKGVCGTDTMDLQNQLISRTGGLGGWDDRVQDHQVIELMASDKKAREGVIRFVLLEGVGQTVHCDDVSADEIATSLQYVRETAS
ncbi:TPA: 3-dehydroquinate synthase [Candidatus Latescibacteria bacterium]|nr:3-dehydroquinate synthase [Candidatus Latescibacterota bacterium]|tara:strand:- start:307 stop:1407 length:1101 start_codon:yes stop_codon:yes gene_type:complete